MARFHLAFILSCLFLATPAQAVASDDPEFPTKLTPAMLEMLEEDLGSYRVWVFFTDKGLPDRAAREAAIAEVAGSYNPRAVKRRLRRGRNHIDGGPLFDVRDLPVHEPYVEQVARTGARVRIRSRWVNAVSAVATRRQIEAIAEIPSVIRVQPVAFSRLPQYVRARSDTPTQKTPTGPGLLDYGRSTSQLTQINLIALHEAGYTANGIIIGVLDTGFRRDHDAFNQPGHEINVIAEYDFVDDDPDTSNEIGDFISQHDHGTMILGTMATYYPGEIVGGAFDASYILAKTEDTTDEYQAEEDNYVAGLEFAEANGADMTTSSIGYIEWYTQADLDGETAVTTIAVNTAGDMGVHTVTAAGNDGHDADPATSHLLAPADAFFVITTGAVTPSGGSASFSSDGPSADGRVKPEVLARGQSTDTISPSDTTEFVSVSGTSISTPQIAAAVACLIQAHPDLTVQQMREALFIHADHDPGGLGFDPAFVRGYGVIDALASQIDAFVPAGSVLFEKDVYSCSDDLVITLRDDNIPGDPETVTVELSSSTETLPETVTLTRVTPGINRYRATLPTTSDPPVNGDGALSLSHGDVLDVEYVDADDGAGGFGIPVQDSASADCQPPVISDVEAGEPTGSTARITWQTDEPADSEVTYGLTPPGLASEADGALVTSHDLQITGLQQCSPYFYSVSSADGVGNLALDDNGGAFHTFETLRDVTPSYASTDTPLPIVDDTTFTSVIEVTDSEIVGDVNVTVDITHTWDADLILKLLPPTGPPILLVDQRGEGGDDFDNTVFDDEASTPIAEGSPPFAGSFRPETPLATADGIDSPGSWTLLVSDEGLLDTGTLNSWTLTLTYLG